MKSPRDSEGGFDDLALEEVESPHQPIRMEDVLRDLRAGLRTKGFLVKYGLSMGEFEQLLKSLIRRRLFTVDEYKEWKARRPSASPSQEPTATASAVSTSQGEKPAQQVVTYVITEPEKNNSWALQLFSTRRELMRGAQFKVNLHGRRYSFIVEEMLFRGQVDMLDSEALSTGEQKARRAEAMEFIAKHGWAAYLEKRAINANLQESSGGVSKKARLVLLHCRNDTFLAALHTPAPAINLYVGTSLANIRGRLAKSVDTNLLDRQLMEPNRNPL
jgi:hypothetical protein